MLERRELGGDHRALARIEVPAYEIFADDECQRFLIVYNKTMVLDHTISEVQPQLKARPITIASVEDFVVV
jgi:hypothetical protein